MSKACFDKPVVSCQYSRSGSSEPPGAKAPAFARVRDFASQNRLRGASDTSPNCRTPSIAFALFELQPPELRSENSDKPQGAQIHNGRKQPDNLHPPVLRTTSFRGCCQSKSARSLRAPSRPEQTAEL